MSLPKLCAQRGAVPLLAEVISQLSWFTKVGKGKASLGMRVGLGSFQQWLQPPPGEPHCMAPGQRQQPHQHQQAEAPIPGWCPGQTSTQPFHTSCTLRSTPRNLLPCSSWARVNAAGCVWSKAKPAGSPGLERPACGPASSVFDLAGQKPGIFFWLNINITVQHRCALALLQQAGRS